MVRLNAGLAACLGEGLQPLVLETLDHEKVYSDKLRVSRDILLLPRDDVGTCRAGSGVVKPVFPGHQRGPPFVNVAVSVVVHGLNLSQAMTEQLRAGVSTDPQASQHRFDSTANISQI